VKKSLLTRVLPKHPDLDQLKRQAKELLDAVRAGEPDAVSEAAARYPGADPQKFALHDAQLVLARAYGFHSWPRFPRRAAFSLLNQLEEKDYESSYFLANDSKVNRRCVMAIAVLAPPSPPESMLDIGKRLAGLLEQAEREAADGQLPDTVRERLTDTVEALRVRLSRKNERDPRSLFDIDERLVDLMDQVEDAVADGGEIPQELVQEINDYLEAFRTKVDRIAGYWRWQESIAAICGTESERLAARKKAAEGRLDRLKNMLLAFMLSRGAKKLEGEKAAIGMQANGMASLVIDDFSKLGGCFFENSLRLTKTEVQEVVYQLTDGELRRRLEATR